MAVSGTPWQLECEKVEQRCGYLLTSGTWSDCTFMVGAETNQEVIQAHKLILAMASPVFEAMFYGGLSEHHDPIVQIPGVQPKAFRGLLQYIYTGEINIESFDMAWDILYGANKYMLPHLITECDRYISSVLNPKNACRTYEFAQFYDNKALMDECIKIISTNTKEVLNDSSFMDVEINTVISVFSLEHLNIDSELDLLHAVARYAEAKQKKQGQISPPVDGGLPSKDKVLQNGESSCQSSSAELDAKISTEVVTSETRSDKEEEPTIRAALQKIRFLTLTAQEFAEGPARSGLLTRDESFKVLMNISSTDSIEPMPSGFSESRERRLPFSDPNEQCFEPGSIEHTIHALKSGDVSKVKDKLIKPAKAARAACYLLWSPSDRQPALDKGILEALVPALTEGDDACKHFAARAICNLCECGSPSQRDVLAASAALQPYCRLLAALQPYCRLLAAQWGDTRSCVLRGLTALLKKAEQQHTKDLLLKLRDIGVPRLLRTVPEDADEWDREDARKLLQTYFE